MTEELPDARFLADLPDIVLVLSGSGDVIWANRTAEIFFQRSIESSRGESALSLVHPDDLELVLRSFETIQSKQQGNPIEVRARVGEQWRLLELIGAPVGWYEADAVLFTLRDLTDRRRFEVAHGDDARFRSILQNATTIVLLVSGDGVVHSVSGALTRMLGHDPELVEGEPLASLIDPGDRTALRAALDQARVKATASRPVTVNVHLRHHHDPEPVDYELSIVNLTDDPTVGQLVITAHDVSARTRAEERLRGALSLLHATLESTPDGLLVVDRDRTITNFNGPFAAMWRLPSSSLDHPDGAAIVQHARHLMSDPDEFIKRIEEIYAEPHADSDDVVTLRDGRIIQRTSKPQLVDGEIRGRVWSFRDVTEQKRLESDLAHLAFHDALTGLANRALFRDRLSQALARAERTGKYVAVLFLDLDNFKNVNDSLGHSAGDELLVAVAQGLVGCLRRSDTAARLGGDEFAVLVEDVDSRDEVIQLAQRIMTTLRRPTSLGPQRVAVTASVGVTFGRTDSTSEQLLRNADLAMYLAKSNGKDRYEEFQDQMHTAVVARLELEADLRHAVTVDEFVVHYQPVVDLTTARVVGVEALVRWRHPTRGLIAPVEFVPFAEEIGLIDRIDDSVLRQASAEVRSWRPRGLIDEDFTLSVNLSARELVDRSLGTRVAATLGDSGLAPTSLILEITESAIMSDAPAAVSNLRSLKEMGLRIALDDFGTGYSTFAHLSTFPIDVVKIDRSFVEAADSKGSAKNVTKAIVQLATTLSLLPIAEGVERPDQVNTLIALGCPLAQGYLLGRPLDAVATAALLEGGRLTR